MYYYIKFILNIKIREMRKDEKQSLNTNYRISITETDYRLPITEYRLPNTEYRFSITDSG